MAIGNMTVELSLLCMIRFNANMDMLSRRWLFVIKIMSSGKFVKFSISRPPPMLSELKNKKLTIHACIRYLGLVDCCHDKK